MKQIFILAGLLFSLIQTGMAQNESEKAPRKTGAERKLIEIEKILELSPAQEQTLKSAYLVNQAASDSILFKVADPMQAAILKYQADKQLQAVLMGTLTDQQKMQYFTVAGTPDVMAKTETQIQSLRESGNYSEQELTLKQKEIFDYLMAEKIVYLREKYNIAKQKENLQQLKKTQPVSLRESDLRKLAELKKILKLSPEQEKTMKAAYLTYQLQSDSILNIADPSQATGLKYQTDKQLQKTVMATLTEEQQIQYFTTLGTPDVTAKTAEKVQLLRESGQYSEQELSQKQKEIFDYIMAEKIVYLRDRFNIAKQKDNINRLKQEQPASLRESDTREKLKATGKINNGKVNW